MEKGDGPSPIATETETSTTNMTDGSHLPSTFPADRPGAVGADLPSGSGGRYRLRERIRRTGNLLVSTRPLVVTRLNDAAVGVVDALSTGEFRTPETVAADTGADRKSVAKLLMALHGRGFLTWRPGRDPSYRPPVSVIVTVRDDATALESCLDALADLDYPEYEVVIVDDGSTDGTDRIIERHPLAPRHVRVGSPDDPLGIGASRNRGVAAASHEVVAFTDADCRPRSDWLAELVPALAVHDVVGGRVRPVGTGSISAYEGINSSLDMGPRGARVRPGSGTPYLPTANLLTRQAVLREVRFPERNVAEDVGFCWAALDAGHDIVYDPAGVVDHDYGDGGRRFAARRRAYGASEALLATEFPTVGAVPIPLVAVLAAVVATLVAVLLVGISGSGFTLPIGGSLPAITPGVAAGAGILVGGLVAGVGTGRPAYRAYRRADGAIPPWALLASLGRRTLSSAYALSRELTRYYALPLGVVATAAAGSGTLASAGTGWATATWVGGAAVWALLAVVIVLPAVVEYAVRRPAASPLAYLWWYLLDHLAYGWGVYRGALAHRTVAHLDPRNRFALMGSGDR